MLVCLNKEDWFRPADRELLVGQIADQLEGLVPRENVIALQAARATRVRTRMLADGSQSEETVDVEADIRPWLSGCDAIVSARRPRSAAGQLVAAVARAGQRGQGPSSKRAGQAGRRDRRSLDVAGRRGRGMSPLPVVDLAAAVAITSHMVLQLARVYRQSIDLDTVSRLLGRVGKAAGLRGRRQRGGARRPPAASPRCSRPFPAIGTITGGVLQGLVQVLVTRWIGGVFIEYFRHEMRTPPSGWASLARSQWDKVTRPDELARLVKTGLARLGATSK